MATKRGKQTRAKTSKQKSTKPTTGAVDRRRTNRRTADDRRVKSVSRAVERRDSADRRAIPDRRQTGGSSEPRVLERAEALRDAILRSKLTAPDPWAYTAKARVWGQRAQSLVDRAARGESPASVRQDLEALTAEVDGDRDYQAARKLF